jgi:hypothetical protein
MIAAMSTSLTNFRFQCGRVLSADPNSESPQVSSELQMFAMRARMIRRLSFAEHNSRSAWDVLWRFLKRAAHRRRCEWGSAALRREVNVTQVQCLAADKVATLVPNYLGIPFRAGDKDILNLHHLQTFRARIEEDWPDWRFSPPPVSRLRKAKEAKRIHNRRVRQADKLAC